MEYIYEMPQAMLCDTPFKGEVKRFLYDAGTYDGVDDHVLHKGRGCTCHIDMIRTRSIMSFI